MSSATNGVTPAASDSPDGASPVPGAHWIVGINDAGMPLFSWAEGMPMPARVMWNIVTGARGAGDGEVVMAVLHSKPAAPTFPAMDTVDPDDVAHLHSLVLMLVGTRALCSGNVDRLKAVLRVATRPALYALERLRVGGGSLVVPSVQLLPRADIPASFCAALATRLASPCVAVSLNGKLCAASGRWWSRLDARDMALLLLLVCSLPPATARDVPLYLPRSALEDDHVPGQTNYRLVTVELSAGLELLVLSTSGNPTIQAALRKTRDLVLKLPAALSECQTLPKDQCPKLSEIHPVLAGVVITSHASSQSRCRRYVFCNSSPAVYAWLEQTAAEFHNVRKLPGQVSDSFVRSQVGVAFTALRSGHFVTVLLADDGVHRLPSLADMESLAERVLEAATGTHGVLSVYAH